MNVPIVEPLENYISRYGAKTVKTILSMPNEELTWVVYNTNMISLAQMLIIALRGLKFFDDYVRVVSHDQKCTSTHGKVYFDPNIFNLMGNGYD